MAEAMTPADVGAVLNNRCYNDGMFGNEGIWLFAILALFGFGGFGGWNNCNNVNYATSADVQRATDFAALERQNNEIMQNTSNVGLGLQSTVKDTAYNTLSEIRDLDMRVNTGFAEAQKAYCGIDKSIMENRYLNAQNTAAINAHTTAQVQKAIDTIKQDKIEALQGRINQLELNNAMSGVVRYPMAMTYAYPANPFCGCNTGCQNI